MPESMHSQLFTQLIERHPHEGEGEAEVCGSRVRVKQAGDAVKLALTRAERIAQDGTKNEKAQAVAAAKAVEATLSPHLENMQKSQAQMQAEVSRINARVEKVFQPPEEKRHIAGAILNHVIGLKSSDKMKLLRQAQDNDDLLTQQAILEMPAYITGLPEKLVEHGREQLAIWQAPNDVMHKQRLEGSLQINSIVTRELSKLVKHYKTNEVEALIEASKQVEAA